MTWPVQNYAWHTGRIIQLINRAKSGNFFTGNIVFLIQRKINDKKVTRRFDDSMSSLSNAKKISMNYIYIYIQKKKCQEYVKLIEAWKWSKLTIK